MPKFLLAFALSALALPAAAADYVQARGSSLVFAGTYQGQPFTGHFPDFGTALSFDPARPDAGRLEVTIPLATATTNNPDYDPEMRGPSFFDVARFATARYTAQGFRALDDGRYAADGTLDLHGVQRPVTLTFTWTPGDQPVLSGRATVPRLAFGVGAGEWASTAIIPDDISISTKVVLAPAP